MVCIAWHMKERLQSHIALPILHQLASNPAPPTKTGIPLSLPVTRQHHPQSGNSIYQEVLEMLQVYT